MTALLSPGPGLWRGPRDVGRARVSGGWRRGCGGEGGRAGGHAAEGRAAPCPGWPRRIAGFCLSLFPSWGCAGLRGPELSWRTKTAPTWSR